MLSLGVLDDLYESLGAEAKTENLVPCTKPPRAVATMRARARPLVVAWLPSPCPSSPAGRLSCSSPATYVRTSFCSASTTNPRHGRTTEEIDVKRRGTDSGHVDRAGVCGQTVVS